MEPAWECPHTELVRNVGVKVAMDEKEVGR
jgi:hypothetical protein